jgi:hypothetical protein
MEDIKGTEIMRSLDDIQVETSDITRKKPQVQVLYRPPCCTVGSTTLSCPACQR